SGPAENRNQRINGGGHRRLLRSGDGRCGRICRIRHHYISVQVLWTATRHLTSARPIRRYRPRAQVAELVDALASGASGFTAVKVRVLSWAPLSPDAIDFVEGPG